MYTMTRTKLRRLHFSDGMMELEHTTPAEIESEGDPFVSVLVRYSEDTPPFVVRVLAEELAEGWSDYLGGRVVMTCDDRVTFRRSHILAVIA